MSLFYPRRLDAPGINIPGDSRIRVRKEKDTQVTLENLQAASIISSFNDDEYNVKFEHRNILTRKTVTVEAKMILVPQDDHYTFYFDTENYIVEFENFVKKLDSRSLHNMILGDNLKHLPQITFVDYHERVRYVQNYTLVKDHIVRRVP